MPTLLLLLTILSANLVHPFDECEGECCPSTAPKPTILTYGDDFGTLLGYEKKTGCYARDAPDKFALFYGRNGCNNMTNQFLITSNILKVTNTRIQYLKSGDFARFSQLVELQIEGNYYLERIFDGVFTNLYNLVNLSIAFNTNLKYLEKNVFVGLHNVQNLFLNNNAFANLGDITRTLTPKTVPNLITLILDSNSFEKINSNDFIQMQNSTLEELSLNLCRIEYINPKALLPLANLQKLHLAENSINSHILTDMLKNMTNAQINLKTLNLYYMGFKKQPPKAMMEIIAQSNISRLSLAKNQFEVINKSSFPLMPNLIFLDLREVLALEITDDAFVNLPNLKILLLSGNRLSKIPRGVLNLQNLAFLDIQENSPADDYHLYFSIRDVDFKNMTNIMYLNLGFNGLSHLFAKTFLGLDNIKYLFLKNSSVFYIEKGTFDFMKELKVLNLMNNVMVHGDTVPDVFYNLIKLEVLLLSGCKFHYIAKHKNPFRNLYNLKYLALDRNLIKVIQPNDLVYLKSLTVIDLSHNIINSWDQRIFSDNINLTKVILTKNKLTDLTVAMLDDFAKVKSIDLDQNAILCKCLVTYRSYVKWYEASHDDVFVNSSIFKAPIYCGYPNQLDNVTVIDFLTKKQYGAHICSYNRFERNFHLPLLICSLAFFVIVAILAFCYRWHIKYWIFLSKLYLSRKGKLKANNNQHKKGYTNYQYDAFVSYSTEDRDFVVKLITMMEKFEPFLKLCVYERDFQIGTIISESVLESVAQSRKTVLVISDNYAKSQWCRWESQICEHHRLFFENEDGEYVDDSLVLIKLSPVSHSNLTPTLKYLLKTRIYLQWEWNEKKQESFWNRLKNTLGPSIMVQNQITHI